VPAISGFLTGFFIDVFIFFMVSLRTNAVQKGGPVLRERPSPDGGGGILFRNLRGAGRIRIYFLNYTLAEGIE
jgi:hypothetical protein